MGQGNSGNRLILLSGGLDSAATLYLSTPALTRALFVDYGQVSLAGEERAARTLSATRGIGLEIARVGDLARLGAGTLVGGAPSRVADGELEAQREEWFPGRNLILVAIGASYAARWGGAELAFGASSEAYRDTRRKFFASAERAVTESLPPELKIAIELPARSRAQMLEAARKNGLEPRLTYSCNRRGNRHCWRCTSCGDRSKLIYGQVPG